MSKKLIKVGNDQALIIDQPILATLGINEKTDLEISVIGDTIIIKPKVGNSEAEKKRQDRILEAANKVMDQYESVFKKLAKT
jgi:antitoxin component of MazEF toxin-antitoxin module